MDNIKRLGLRVPVELWERLVRESTNTRLDGKLESLNDITIKALERELIRREKERKA